MGKLQTILKKFRIQLSVAKTCYVIVLSKPESKPVKHEKVSCNQSRGTSMGFFRWSCQGRTNGSQLYMGQIILAVTVGYTCLITAYRRIKYDFFNTKTVFTIFHKILAFLSYDNSIFQILRWVARLQYQVYMCGSALKIMTLRNVTQRFMSFNVINGTYCNTGIEVTSLMNICLNIHSILAIKQCELCIRPKSPNAIKLHWSTSHCKCPNQMQVLSKMVQLLSVHKRIQHIITKKKCATDEAVTGKVNKLDVYFPNRRVQCHQRYAVLEYHLSWLLWKNNGYIQLTKCR